MEVPEPEVTSKKDRKDTSRPSDDKTNKISSADVDDIPYTFEGTKCWQEHTPAIYSCTALLKHQSIN